MRLKHLLFLSLLFGLAQSYSSFEVEKDGEGRNIQKEDASIIFSQPLSGGTTLKRDKRAPVPSEFTESTFIESNFGEDDKWTFKLAVFTTFPYYPNISSISFTLGSNSINREFNGASFNLSECVLDPVSKDCYQEFILTANGCEEFEFRTQYFLNATCRTDLTALDMADCLITLPLNQTVDLSLHSASSCPLSTIVTSTPILRSFSSTSYTNDTSSFNATDVIYFGAKIGQERNEILDSVTVNKVCAYSGTGPSLVNCPNNVTSLRLDNISGTGFDSAFNVRADELSALAGVTNNAVFTVQIDFLLSYKNGQKRNLVREESFGQTTLSVYSPPIPHNSSPFLSKLKEELFKSNQKPRQKRNSEEELEDPRVFTPSSASTNFSTSLSLGVFMLINAVLIFS